MKVARKLNPRKLILAKAIADRSALFAGMQTVLHIHNLPYLLSLSAEIHFRSTGITPFYSIVYIMNSTAY